MHAQVGDWLVVPEGPGRPHPRRGLVVGLVHPDGTPPYRVCWLDDHHESVVFPPAGAHVRRPYPAAPVGREARGGVV